MNEHRKYEEWLPLYVSGELDPAQRREMENHLTTCDLCREECSIWQETSDAVNAGDRMLKPSTNLLPRAIHAIHHRSSPFNELARAWAILKFQVPVVKRDLWPASAAVVFIGVAVSIVANRIQLFSWVAPLMAAAMIAAIYGPENDEAGELTNSTRTSQWKILLARLALVFSYNLGLGLIGTLSLSLFTDVSLFWPILAAWLAPMAFLSMLALLLSMWLGTGKAIGTVYAFWLLQYIPLSIFNLWGDNTATMQFQDTFAAFWQNPQLLLGLAGLLLAFALLSCSLQGFKSAGRNA